MSRLTRTLFVEQGFTRSAIQCRVLPGIGDRCLEGEATGVKLGEACRNLYV